MSRLTCRVPHVKDQANAKLNNTNASKPNSSIWARGNVGCTHRCRSAGCLCMEYMLSGTNEIGRITKHQEHTDFVLPAFQVGCRPKKTLKANPSQTEARICIRHLSYPCPIYSLKRTLDNHQTWDRRDLNHRPLQSAALGPNACGRRILFRSKFSSSFMAGQLSYRSIRLLWVVDGVAGMCSALRGNWVRGTEYATSETSCRASLRLNVQ